MKHRIVSGAIVALSLCNSQLAVAQVADSETITLPETVVTATRVETPIEEVGRSVDVRTRAEITAQESFNLAESLQTVAGLRITEVGGPGSPGVTPVEIRGFRSSGTQFLLNGLRYNDPSSISGTNQSFASYLTVDDLSRIEVVKGATSVLYGSDGQAGAINLFTLRPEAGRTVEATVQAGSFGTIQESVSFNAGDGTNGIAGTVSRIDSDGIDTHGNYENTGATVSGELALSDSFSLRPLVRVIDAKQDLDRGPSLSPEGTLVTSSDSERDNVEATHVFAGLTGAYQTEDLESQLSVYVNDASRDFLFEFGGFESPFSYEGQSFNTDWQNVVPLDAINSKVIAGFDYEHQSADSDSLELQDSGTQDRYGLFAKVRSEFIDSALKTDIGVRLSHVSSIGETLPTFEASSVVDIPETPLQLHASLAQGFRAPTLYETDGLAVDYMTNQIVNVGSRNLEAEESLTVDGGLRWNLTDRSFIDTTAFHINSDETILFDFENLTHRNGGSAETHGVETTLAYQPCEWLTLRAAHTYIGKADGLDHQRLQNRPYNTFAASATAQYEKATLFTEVRFRGDQELAFFGTDTRLTEGDYTLVNMTASYKLIPSTDVFVKATNLFDRDYTEFGYVMPGVGVFGGLRLKLDLLS